MNTRRRNPAAGYDKHLERYYGFMKNFGAKPKITQQIFLILKRHDVELSDFNRLLRTAVNQDFETVIDSFALVFPGIMSEEEDYDPYTKLIDTMKKTPRKAMSILFTAPWLIALAAEGNRYASRFMRIKTDKFKVNLLNE